MPLFQTFIALIWMVICLLQCRNITLFSTVKVVLIERFSYLSDSANRFWVKAYSRTLTFQYILTNLVLNILLYLASMKLSHLVLWLVEKSVCRKNPVIRLDLDFEL